jgi:hypothetical protein
MNAPILIGGHLESLKIGKLFQDTVLTDDAIAQRIDFALKGLKP